MGNRTSLTIGTESEIEANNCIPINWLALFGPDDFGIETLQEELEEYQVALFRSTVEQSRKRLGAAIQLLQGKTSVWRYLRPLGTLKELLASHDGDTQVILNATQIWAYDASMGRDLENANGNFTQFVDGITGEINKDLLSINHLIETYNLGTFSSIREIPTSSLINILFGTYFGRNENQYSSEALNVEYWSGEAAGIDKIGIQDRERDLETEFNKDDLDIINHSLEYYLKPPLAGWKYKNAASCYTQLLDYKNAQSYYRLAIDAFLKSHISIVLPSDLIDSYTLSNQPRLHKKIGKKVLSLVRDANRIHPGERYALIVHSFLSSNNIDLNVHINELINFSEDEYHQVLGKSFESIIRGDEIQIKYGLIFLLDKHQNEMKNGIIRNSYLCLEAMTLSLLSSLRDLDVHIKSKYYSEGYIKFLISERNHPKGFLWQANNSLHLTRDARRFDVE